MILCRGWSDAGLLALLCVVAVISNTARAAKPDRARPNVVFILTDDQRWDQLGCEGHPFLKTPN